MEDESRKDGLAEGKKETRKDQPGTAGDCIKPEVSGREAWEASIPHFLLLAIDLPPIAGGPIQEG